MAELAPRLRSKIEDFIDLSITILILGFVLLRRQESRVMPCQHFGQHDSSNSIELATVVSISLFHNAIRLGIS